MRPIKKVQNHKIVTKWARKNSFFNFFTPPKLSGSSSNMSGSTVTANNFFAFHTVLKTSEDYYEAMRWARRLANNISDTINRNVSGMY